MFGETALVNGESLAAGIHTQTLTNVAGCDSTLSITITEAESIAITDPIDQVVCSGESVTLSVTEAANLTYQWQQVCSEEITVFTDTPGSGFPMILLLMLLSTMVCYISQSKVEA